MVTIRHTHPTYLAVWRQGLPVRRQSRICTRPLKCISRDCVRMGFLFLNQLPLQSMWLSSKNLGIPSLFLSLSPSKIVSSNPFPPDRGCGVIHNKVGPSDYNPHGAQ